jgi:hypothetical protein
MFPFRAETLADELFSEPPAEEVPVTSLVRGPRTLAARIAGSGARPNPARTPPIRTTSSPGRIIPMTSAVSRPEKTNMAATIHGPEIAKRKAVRRFMGRPVK